MAITGASGQVGSELARTFRDNGDEILALSRPDFDICRGTDLERLAAWSPEIVVNSAAWTDVDGCARDPARAMEVNGVAAGEVARAAATAGALVVQISTNEVFDGTLGRPYREDDEPNPLNPYGASKLAGERLVERVNDRHLIIRTAWVHSAGHGFPARIRAAADRARDVGATLRVVGDEWGNPTPAPWLADAILHLVGANADEGQMRVLHLAGMPPVSRFSWASHFLRASRVALEEISTAEFPRASRVPKHAVLDCSRAAAHGIALADWRNPG